jgi:hypothetical protein
MIDLKLTGVLLFLVPGLCAYCAVFQVFGAVQHGFTERGRMLPTPPSANSIKTVTLILLWSLAAHGVTSVAIAGTHWLYQFVPLITLPAWVNDDPYAVATSAGRTSARELAQLLFGAIMQGLISIFIVQWWLKRRVRTNTLPRWLYGWSAELANLVDDDDKVVTLWILTTTDIDGHALVYSGGLTDLAIRSDGNIGSISLEKCERYVVSLATPFFTSDLQPLSVFPNLTIEGSQIRNLTIEVFTWDDLLDFDPDELPDFAAPPSELAVRPTPPAR